MVYFIVVIVIVMSLAIPGTAIFLGRRVRSHTGDDEAAQLREESESLDKKLVEVLSESDHRASTAQVGYLTEQCSLLQQTLAEQRAALQELSSRVDDTRGSVQEREAQLQNLRASKEEDEIAISQTLGRYHEFSTESLSLEQKLAESLKTLDVMANEIKMTPDQQAVFAELSNALTQASAQLRDVIIDYQNANERLTSLNERFTELEEEYSKLVEQQLSG